MNAWCCQRMVKSFRAGFSCWSVQGRTARVILRDEVVVMSSIMSWLYIRG